EVGRIVEQLPVEVRELHGVGVHQPEYPDARARENEGGMASEPADADDEDAAAGEGRFESRVHAHGNKKPLPRGKGLTSVRTLSSAGPHGSASELAPASRRTGCCGFAGPCPPPLWIRLCFFFSPARELTRKVRLCQCAAFQSAASDAAQARGIRDLSAGGARVHRGAHHAGATSASVRSMHQSAESEPIA